MKIKEVNSEEEYKKICSYLKKFKMDKPNSICLYYATPDDSDEIIGVSGFEYVPMIEPMAANSGNVMDRLYDTVMEQMKKKVIKINADRIEAYVSDSKVDYIGKMLKKKGFKHIEKLNRFAKILE